MNTIAITGASGYIGRHLVAGLIRVDDWRIRVLANSTRQDSQTRVHDSRVEVVEGDLREARTLRQYLDPGCTVVNLVYLWDAGEKENLAVTSNLLEACRAAKIGRLIHCSTAAVVGRVADDLVTEATSCQPITEYGITKLKVETAILEAARGSFDSAILRPTSVFGPGGVSLQKLAGDLTGGSRIQNYLKSCLFGRRRMNLVHIANVVAAIIFLAQRTESLGGALFIVSDDDDPSNNFTDVERFLMSNLYIPDYRLPRVPLPPVLLKFLLRCLRRNNVNPRCNYDPGKLIGFGFRRPVSLEAGLAEYAAWYRATHFGGKA